MGYVIAGVLLAQQYLLLEPSITTWSRLEVQPTTPDLHPGLSAQVADPLWLMHRQWAFGELAGEDAGSPIDVRLAGEQARLARYHPGLPPGGAAAAAGAVDYSDLDAPLEIVVEREPVRGDHPRLAAASGQQFIRRLRAEGGSAMVERFVAAYPLTIPDPDDPIADELGAAWSQIVESRALDGDALAAAVARRRSSDGSISALPAQPSIPQSHRIRVTRALERWMDWYDSTVSEPVTQSAWNPTRQEYAFALSAQMSHGRVVLRADEYTDGRLDWYSFQVSGTPNLGAPDEPMEPEDVEPAAMLPSQVRYPGMPADRYWEFEDARVNLGAPDAGPTDLGRLLLVEFGLVFGNDWYVVPLDMPVGSLFQIRDLTIRDTFGVETAVGPSRSSSGSPWEIFELGVVGRGAARLADLFFLPPTLPRRLEGDPIEEVNLLRDEMANMAWGVERRVPGASGEAVDRHLQTSRAAVRQQVVGDPGDATLLYRLATPVPENWIPFIPVASAPITSPAYDVQLERRTLLRFHEDGTTSEVHPRGLLLRTDLTQDVDTEPPLRLEEEEVPRAGAIVTRSFQFARWLGGRGYLWVGRAKRTGRGEGSSGLRHDTSDPS